MNVQGSVTQVLPIEDASQIGHARRVAQRLAEQHNFDVTDAGRVALLATELASNVLKHAGSGELHLRAVQGQDGAGVEIIAVDRGPGFDLNQCLTDGYSSSGTQGIGLGALARQAQVFDAFSDARGSVVLAQLFPRGVKPPRWRYGVSQQPFPGEIACGDDWHLALDEQRCSVLMIDGIGHGELAQQAAHAGSAAFGENPFVSPSALFDDMHRAMNGGRGGAVAVAQFDRQRQALSFAGIGNIGASLIGSDGSRGLASHPGIVGVRFRKAHVFDYPRGDARLLVLYSDGLQSRWNLRDYPGLVHRHPAIIAALLQRDFCRGRDDVTVLALNLEDTCG
ncbi:ATP-binding protein [Pseudomonas stutzeri]|uniref:Transcriptional regulator n=1 Tax=Stutzerimonas stutzeri TaxID=316 RepID=A0A2N8RYP5_STUST|nr:ATP-binding protein [Stutzerimonas stutzeri]MCQ4295903.1 ATP-binding protein [Stutzerimonas stutzeri]PNF79497.1 transcriptional regulator [Stutzerimonas stutzeri]